MKKISIISILFFSLQIVVSQNITNAEIASEVDKQIWEPFKTSYIEGDASTFNSLHTEDIIRITKRGIKKGQIYKDENTQWLTQPNRQKRSIDFVFEHRIYSEDTGYEVGYYKIATPGSPDLGAHYARFTVLLRKVDGVWKIAQDWDTDKINGQRVTSKDFDKLLSN
ncbi:MAG: nuclear transport factor 2 family protein [Flavobacteriaceae bacterium]|nr:nuclear transport factor 2 family protein [Flavobacteriaceae bacterium]